ncbi:MAG: helix-turn-helix transcriptional regulator [Ruminococcaceae bacterium]|nr:helix-turn-helix transcriptional regulator [Oscillospiraceae bacterium]
MKLNEKIILCRRRAGLSQEGLAEQVGVSRQAVSKWECGEATPEPAKLLALSRLFGVTADWLLDDNLGEPEPAQEEPAGRAQTLDSEPNPTTQNNYYAAPSWIDSAPGLIARFLRRWGWLAGVYLMIIGLLFTGIGVAGRLMFGFAFDSMKQTEEVFFEEVGGMWGSSAGMIIQDENGNPVDLPDEVRDQIYTDIYGSMPGTSLPQVSTVTSGFGSAMVIIPNLIITIGVIMIIGGGVLALVLRRMGRGKQSA